MNEQIVMRDSPESAQYRTDLKGWVSRDGFYFGDGPQGERTARYAGCTHAGHGGRVRGAACPLQHVPNTGRYGHCHGSRRHTGTWRCRADGCSVGAAHGFTDGVWGRKGDPDRK